MGKTIDGDDYTDTLLASLPASYDLHNASAKVFPNEIRTTHQKPDQEEAFAAEANKKDIECHNCKKRGHVEANGWKTGGGKEGQRPTRRGKGQGTDSAASASADIKALAAIVDGKWSGQKWSRRWKKMPSKR